MAKPKNAAEAVPPQQPPPDMGEQQPFDWSQEQTTGFEHVTREDLGVPFLAICQSKSPEFDRSQPNYEQKRIPGIKPGDIFNTVSRVIVFDCDVPAQPLNFIPCAYEKLFVEWKPSRGGFVQAHRTAAILEGCSKDDRNRDIRPNGNMIVPTAYFAGLYVTPDDDEVRQAVIAMTSTQLKKARSWLNTAQSIKVDGPNGKYTPPLYSRWYLISTGPESNDSGSWFGWKLETGRPLADVKLISSVREAVKQITAPNRALLAPPAETADEAF